MNDDAKHMIAAYQRVFQGLPWQAFPFDERMMYTGNDGIIRDALLQLHQLDSTTPSPEAFESAATDLHYVMVGYEQQLVLYWLTHFIQEGDRGYMLYRISQFIDPSFNFIDYSYRFRLPEASLAKVYMEVFSRLNDWARLLELPYRYEVELRDDYMGYQKNVDSSPVKAKEMVPVVDNISIWRRLWTHWLR